MTEDMMDRISPWKLLPLVVLALFIASCASLVLPAVDDDITDPPARPAVLGAFGEAGPVRDARTWTRERVPALRRAFERHVYGPVPSWREPRDTVSANFFSPDNRARYRIKDLTFGGRGIVEQFPMSFETGDGVRELNVVLALPAEGEGPFPTIVIQSFSDPHCTFGNHPQVNSNLAGGAQGCGSFMRFAAENIFGANIIRPPFETLLERGYAVAVFNPSAVVPDTIEGARASFESLRAVMGEDAPTGTLAAWAWFYSRAIDHLDTHPALDPARTALWGHSRYGKAAVLAAAFDLRADLVVSHQSGRGGASLSRSTQGETVAQIMESYPHWFDPAYAEYGGRVQDIPVDQHQLLAMIAPRPLLLGNGRRDRWTDPTGAFLAAQGADPVYDLLGSDGLEQSTMTQTNLTADVGFFIRSGYHGIYPRDWELMLEFLDHHFRM